MLTSHKSRACDHHDLEVQADPISSNFFPPISEAEPPKEHATEPAELASQLPDAPTTEPADTTEAVQPSPKKQKIDDSDDDFVVVDKDDLKDDESKSEL